MSEATNTNLMDTEPGGENTGGVVLEADLEKFDQGRRGWMMLGGWTM